MSDRNFFAELKGRNVYKVAVAYAAVGWLLIQIATTTFPVLQIPTWAQNLLKRQKRGEDEKQLCFC